MTEEAETEEAETGEAETGEAATGRAKMRGPAHLGRTVGLVGFIVLLLPLISADTARRLLPGETVTLAVAPSEVVRYSLDLPADHALRLVVDQRGMDVTSTLSNPAGAPVAVADRNLGEDGEEWFEMVTSSAGTYDLRIQGSSKLRPAGTVSLELSPLHPATLRDRQVAAAFETFSRGAGLLAVSEGADRAALLLAAAERFEALGYPLYQAETLTRLVGFASTGSDREALWSQALELFQQADDLPSQAWAHNGLGGVLVGLDRYGEAETHYLASLEITAALPDRKRRILALDGLGKAARNQGKAQEALELLEEASSLWREHEVRNVGSSLHELGVLYLWNLHQPETALRYLEGAMESWRTLANEGSPPAESEVDKTLGQLAQAYLGLGDLDRARAFLQEALDLQSRRSCRVIPTLTKLAELERREGAPSEARAYLLQAAQNLGLGCPREESTVWLAHLDFFLAQEAPKSALLAAQRCTEVFERRGDSLGTAVCDGGRARALRMQGKSTAALDAAGRALAAYEETRPGIDRSDLRSSFFGGIQEIFNVQIALLQDLGRDSAAFEVAERAHARSFRDGLREAGAKIRRDAAPELLQQERNLRLRLDRLDEESRSVAPGSNRTTIVQAAMEEALEDLETARGEIRRRAPEYAQLLRETTVTASQIQEALPQDHLLLTFRLGDQESTLWALTRDDIQSFRLPPRGRIETLASEARGQLRSLRWGGIRSSLCQLSEMLLGPAQSLLPGHALLLVLDGALADLPFAALPRPGSTSACPTAPFLGEEHSILYLPSASLLVDKPWSRPGNTADRPWLAMVADPVYSAADSRLQTTARHTAAKPSAAKPSAALPRTTPSRVEALDRLVYSAAEADAVLAQVPEHRRIALLGMAARRDNVLAGSVSSARILHFAVHGVHTPQPLLSRLALSRYGSDGSPLAGDLFAYELYDLDLAADLVVLSACDTASGTQVRGEGPVSGLVRGFFYAGADRVLASLWPVPDSDTAELMSHFYRGLLEEELSPASALQQAQKKLRVGGAPPRAWAGFVLQGTPDPMPLFLP